MSAEARLRNRCSEAVRIRKELKNFELQFREGSIHYRMILHIEIDAYSSLDRVAFAWNMVRSMGKRDNITYTSLVIRFNELGKYEMALSVINHMYGNGIRIDKFCLPRVISASTNLGALEEGKHLQCYSMKSGYSSSVSVLNSLIDMYGKFGRLEDAKKCSKRWLTLMCFLGTCWFLV